MSHPLFVRTLTDQESDELLQMIHRDGDARILRRAQVVRLAARASIMNLIGNGTDLLIHELTNSPMSSFGGWLD